MTSAGATVPHVPQRAIPRRAPEGPDGDVGLALLGAALLAERPSITEVAALTGVDRSRVADAFEWAWASGLGVVGDDATITFPSALARRLLIERAPLAQRLDLHARAAEQLARNPHDADQAVRAAEHARAAWSRSPADAEQAVRLCRAAAARLLGRGDTVSATRYARHALDVAERALPERPRAALHVELAEAWRAGGRLGEARRDFRTAAEVAEREGDEISLAAAAIGLGGIWLNEHPASDQAAYLSGLLRRSLEALGPDHAAERRGADKSALRARIELRLAAEAAYRGTGSVDDALAAAERVRASCGPDQVVEGLSLVHHLLLGPHRQTAREAVSAEMLGTLGPDVSPLTALMVLCWHTVDRVLAAAPSTPRAIVELRERAEELGCESLAHIAASMSVMTAIRAGRFGEAEAAATTCYEQGTAAGDTDAVFFVAAQLGAIRFFQGREAELASLFADVAHSPDLAEGDRAVEAAAALFRLRAGDDVPASSLLARVAAGDLPVTSSSWLVAMAAYAEMAHTLDHADAAAVIYRELEPFAPLPVMASLGVACYGPVERYLALAAATAGRTHAGIDHARRAVLACERLDHRPALALCLGQLAGLLAAGNHADRAEAGRHLDRARAIAGELGMDGWIDRWGPVSREVTPAVQFQRLDQGGWRVRLGDAVATLPDLAGVTYLAELARHPGREVPALSLIAPAAGGGSSRQVLLDRTALAQLKDRSTQLRARLDVCEPWERDRLEAELDQVLRTVREAVGMGEHARTFTDDEERARTAVRKAIVRAIAMLARVEPGIAGHLEATVRTGRQCRYDPTAV